MIKRTIEISNGPTHISSQRKQLILKRDGEQIGQIPCEDIGMVIVDHPATSISLPAISLLMKEKAAFIICGTDHLPQGMFLPFADHTQIVTRLHTQIDAPKPLQKRLWKQIVQAKIRAQADNLQSNSAPHKLLMNLAKDVKAGDTTNREAHAAKVYWQNWLTCPDDIEVDDEGLEIIADAYRRDRHGDSPNSLLNYGYAILRAAVARAIVSAGLQPALGIHHKNRSNPFCLADDLMEPFRPIVDCRVRELFFAGETEINQETKAQLLDLLTIRINYKEHSGPLMVSLHHYVASFVRCLERTETLMEIPQLCHLVDTELCGL
ncbi:CRISPR-associated protein Cas1 [hydrothermal vent metagenome]|uniref:CRISPR-associated protein Cas1 n=1 Tax=hydrothermal vent metagenome TaxID=652676 RepID=A0A3B1D6R4_9ZZZZ